MKRIVGGLLLLGALKFGQQFLEQRAPKLEISDFACQKQRDGVVVSGTVKNLTEKPLSLASNASLVFVGDTPAMKAGLLSREVSGTVRPNPLPAGESGRFFITAPIVARHASPVANDAGQMMSDGDCRLEPFTDESSGARINYRAAGSK